MITENKNLILHLLNYRTSIAIINEYQPGMKLRGAKSEKVVPIGTAKKQSHVFMCDKVVELKVKSSLE